MAKRPQMPRALLASGIFPPDVGGPATHVRKIAEHMHARGWSVVVVAFGDRAGEEPYRVVRTSRRLPKLLSWPLYALRLAREAWRCDVVYAFDLTTAGLPCATMARLLRKPFILRIGGDPIWERQVERSLRFMPMRDYYEQSLYRTDKPLLFVLIRFVVHSAHTVVTYCDFLRDIYVHYYGLSAQRVQIFANPLPIQNILPSEEETFTFMFAGRFVSYKNLPRVLRAFSRLVKTHPRARLLLVGDGPEESAIRELARPLGERVRILPKVSQQELFALVGQSSAALAPALTEFNPNFILEALSLGRPALISQDNGLSVVLPAQWTFDPLSDDSFFGAMEHMLDARAYQEALSFVRDLPGVRGWEPVLSAHEKLLASSAGLL